MPWILTAALLLAAVCGAADAAPARVVSINLCTDILLMKLADRAQIASVSFLAAEPSGSVVADQLTGIPINYGRAEEVRLMNPDLVLAGTYGARFAVQILKEHGYRVVEVPPAMSLEEIAPAIETVGAAIGQGARAKAMADGIRERIAKMSGSSVRSRPSAIVFQPRGFATGRPSLADDVLTLAGATNRAADTGFMDWVPLGVEGLLGLNPDLVVIDDTEEAPPAMAKGILAHRALRVFAKEGRLFRAPSKLWSCGIPETLDVVADLRAELTEWSAAHVH